MDWRGFELHPETPAGGILLRDYFPGPRFEAMQKYMAAFAADFGVTDMGQPERLPNTRRVLAAAEYARTQGRLDAFRAGAMEAHWVHGLNLENTGDIRSIAISTGLDPNAVVSAMDDPVYLTSVDDARRDAEDHMVSGIPTFFFNDMMVVGCQPYEKLSIIAKKAGAVRRQH